MHFGGDGPHGAHSPASGDARLTVWPLPAVCCTQVHLCGSFTRWVETVPMAPVEGQSGTFSVIVHLPPGCVARPACRAAPRPQAALDTTVCWVACKLTLAPSTSCTCRYHQYKFIVDGEWRHDETQPFMPDPLGNVNNWLFVRKPDAG